MSNERHSWGWKLATNPDDAMNFLNGTEPYSRPVRDVKICAVWKDGHQEFLIYYQKEAPVASITLTLARTRGLCPSWGSACPSEKKERKKIEQNERNCFTFILFLL